ncbi:hypothetical protein [Cryobacterium sp. Y82]|uniref:hypothetical protein n=1 Tax=Cryobacterium sp. Y82 TaxID=2045017 RepID=UPI000CE2C076|nr:hypothetical protein [Cryobacterium sp. Y82]
MRGRPGQELHLRISNTLLLGRVDPSSGGLGLIGLTERVNMVSGTLTNLVADERFILDATLPWEMPS